MLEKTIGGHYTLQHEIGSGSMGTVYLGLHTVTNQQVAIKALKAEIAQPDNIERFKREGEALRDLNHPNIVKMLDMFEHDDQHCLVMEYISDGDLSDLLQQANHAFAEAIIALRSNNPIGQPRRIFDNCSGFISSR
jgi:serine/threonine protein kinase